MAERLTRNDFTNQILEKVRVMSADGADVGTPHWTPEEHEDYRSAMAEIRDMLKLLSEDAFHLLHDAITTGYGVDCPCGREVHICGYTADISIREPKARHST
jgi:hypothetical protein